MAQQTFTLPDGRAWALPEFVRSPEEAAERDRLLTSRYYLVQQGSLGEIFRCRRCKTRHTYLTLQCIEQPFSGITEGLWAYYKAAGTPQAFLRMTPDERRRVESVRRLLGPSAGLPDLSAGHPQFARSLAVAERDLEVGAVPMGVLEEIPASLAQRFVDRINGQLPIDARLHVPGLTA